MALVCFCWGLVYGLRLCVRMFKTTSHLTSLKVEGNEGLYLTTGWVFILPTRVFLQPSPGQQRPMYPTRAEKKPETLLGPRTGGKGTGSKTRGGGSLNFREDPGRAETGPTFIVRSDSFFFRLAHQRPREGGTGTRSRLQRDPTRGLKKTAHRAIQGFCSCRGGCGVEIDLS